MSDYPQPQKCSCPGPHHDRYSPLPPGACNGPAAYVLPNGSFRCTRCVYSDDSHRLLPDICSYYAGAYWDWDALGFIVLLDDIGRTEAGRAAG